jgi:hypothetical protein
MALINVIIFALTQDMSQPMVLFDAWTVIMALILIAELVVLLVGARKQDPTDDEEAGQEGQTAYQA